MSDAIEDDETCPGDHLLRASAIYVDREDAVLARPARVIGQGGGSSGSNCASAVSSSMSSRIEQPMMSSAPSRNSARLTRSPWTATSRDAQRRKRAERVRSGKSRRERRVSRSIVRNTPQNRFLSSQSRSQAPAGENAQAVLARPRRASSSEANPSASCQPGEPCPTPTRQASARRH